MKVAAIDIGTNTVLLAIVESEEGVTDVADLTTITRLGEGLGIRGSLAADPMERTFAALRRYVAVAEELAVDRLLCAGTAALREADNSALFLERAKRELGLNIRVLTAREEARYTFLSIRGDDAFPAPSLTVIDIGGGSTEVIHGEGPLVVHSRSLPVGSVRLTEMFIRRDPPASEELAALRTYLAPLASLPTVPPNGLLVGTAGTVTTAASLILSRPYSKKDVHGLRISVGNLEDLVRMLTAMPVSARRGLTGMEAGREDVLLQGIILLEMLMKGMGAREIAVSVKGVRYGLIYEYLSERGALSSGR